ncbi:hypothetical protein Bbelb_292910 [Branchiostoma belcheri]|nr:hypothetical protein Bbelb_292910 [Branchiostoma belcheri]
MASKDGTLNCRKDEVRLQKWLTAVKSHLQPAWTIEKIRAINNTQSPAYVFTEHFSSACCSENMKARLFQGKRPAKVLSEDAVPTIFGERKAGESSTSDLGQTAHRQVYSSRATLHLQVYSSRATLHLQVYSSRATLHLQVYSSRATLHLQVYSSRATLHLQVYSSRATLHLQVYSSRATLHLQVYNSRASFHLQVYSSRATLHLQIWMHFTIMISQVTTLMKLHSHHLTHLDPASHCGYWHSQPHVGDSTSFEGNLLLPAAIIKAGGTFTKFSDISQTLSPQCFGEMQFKEVQRKVVFPVIDEHYLSEQQGVLSLFCNQGEEEDTTKVTLLGDGRCDSPGYNAKYCCYTFMEEQRKYIVDFQLVQVSETTSSQAMEKMGFLRSLEFLQNEGMSIECIATDRHVGIRAALKQRQYRDIDHQFDIFHMAKSVNKKLAAHANTRNKKDLFPWLKAVSTHLWWCSKTCGENAVKWRSVANHVANRHEGFEENHTFTECDHLPLSEEDRADIKWLKPGSDAHKALYEVVNAPALLRDLAHLTKFKHKGALEVFHSMLLKYADKRPYFPYPSMKARLQLAVMDHNENVHRQATTKHGDRKWDAAWSKRAADWISRRRYQTKTFSFREELMNEVLEKASVGSYRSGQHVLPDPDVGERPDKAALVEKFLSRFEGH